MSKENKITVDVYKNGGAEKYLINCKVHDELDQEKANRKREKLNKFILSSFSTLSKGDSIFEIGSANGETAKFMQDSGYNVTASDVATAFIEATKKLNVNTIKFNVLEDEFKQKYNGMYCWRVFVHFTTEDFTKALTNVYSGLEDNGIFIFNVMNRDIKDVDGEMVDFAGEYYMGAERYYHYFSKNLVDDIIKNIGFNIVSFHTEGGDSNNKWLVYVLKK